MAEFHEKVEIYSPDVHGRNPEDMDIQGKLTILLDDQTGDIVSHDNLGHHSFSLHGNIGDYTGLWIGANKAEGAKAGKVFLRDSSGNDSITLDGSSGDIFLRGSSGNKSITLDGSSGDITSYDQNGHHSFSLHGNIGDYTGLWIGANKAEGAKAGKVFLRDSSGNDSITLDGSSGDIFLSNADCAEDFDISDSRKAEPGTVMVLEQEGKLRQCTMAYDKKVAGVISGGGDCKPGIVMDKKPTHSVRQPVALMGKVYCKVDAQFCPVEVGDLLTTSSTAGHAMKARILPVLLERL